MRSGSSTTSLYSMLSETDPTVIADPATSPEERIRELEALNRELLELLTGSQMGAVLLDTDLAIRRFTPATDQYLTITRDDIGRSITRLTTQLGNFPLVHHLLRSLQTNAAAELETVTTTGTSVLIRINPHQTDDSADSYLVLNFINIDELSRTRKKLLHNQSLLRNIIDMVPYPIFARDSQGRFIVANEAKARQYNLSVRDLVNMNIDDLPVSKHHRQANRMEDDQVIREMRSIHIPERQIIDGDGSARYIQTTKMPLATNDPTNPMVIGVSVDVTDRKLEQDALRKRALYDRLTGLPNRDLFIERTKHAIERSQRRDALSFAILFMDVDGFKKINDRYGHIAGDALLREVAHRVTDSARPGDTVTRYGGDEFALLLTEISDWEEVMAVSHRIHTAMSGAIEVEGQAVSVSTSIGAVLGGAQAEDPYDLLRSADAAMYEAKRAGHGQTRCSDDHYLE